MPVYLKHSFIGILFTVSCNILLGQTPIYFHYNSNDGLPSNLVYCAAQDTRGFMWFGTDNGLVRFDGTNFQTFGVEDGLPDPEVLGLTQDSRGRMWISCFRKSLAYWDGKQIVNESKDNVLQKINLSSSVATLFEDSDKNIWIAAASSYYFQLKNKEIIKGEQHMGVLQFDQIDKQIISLNATSISGIDSNHKDTLLFRFPDPYGSGYSAGKKVMFASYCRSGNRLLYSFSDKLFLLEWKDGQIKIIDQKKQLGGRVFADNQGRFWLCTLSNGAICFDNNKKDLSNPKTYLPQKKISYMLQDNQGSYWFGSLDDGIYCLPENALQLYFQVQDSKDLSILGKSPTGELLIGDKTGNLHFVTEGQSKTVSFGGTERYNLIRQVLALPNQTYWIVSDESFFRYKNGEIEKVDLFGRTSPKAIYYHKNKLWYGTSYKLGFWSYSIYSHNDILYKRITCIEADSNENLWAGSTDGLYSEADQFRLNWGDSFPILKSRITSIKAGVNGRLWVCYLQRQD
ncbi:MAG: two-component regulator propeller domain-containing protein [Saprospiraceae bacterium]